MRGPGPCLLVLLLSAQVAACGAKEDDDSGLPGDGASEDGGTAEGGSADDGSDGGPEHGGSDGGTADGGADGGSEDGGGGDRHRQRRRWLPGLCGL